MLNDPNAAEFDINAVPVADLSDKTKTLKPHFYVERVLQTFQSELEGRAIYKDEEFISFQIPGNRDCQPVARVEDYHRQKYAPYYAAFKKGQKTGVTEDGLSLTDWPPIGKSEIEEYNRFYVYTVEQLANLSDGACQTIGLGALERRDQAKAYLSRVDDSKFATNLSQENKKLHIEVGTLQSQINAMMEMVEALQKSKKIDEDEANGEDDDDGAMRPARRGRPPKLARDTALEL